MMSSPEYNTSLCQRYCAYISFIVSLYSHGRTIWFSEDGAKSHTRFRLAFFVHIKKKMRIFKQPHVGLNFPRCNI